MKTFIRKSSGLGLKLGKKVLKVTAKAAPPIILGAVEYTKDFVSDSYYVFAGRRKEEKLIEKLDSIISNDDVIKKLGDMILSGDGRAMNLYFGYRYGKPKESVDINSSEGFNINFKDLIKFK